jgi:hypothetical protein
MLIKQKHLFNKEECQIIINNINLKNQQDWSDNDRKYNSHAIDYSIESSWIFDRLKSFVEMETDIEFRTIKKQIHFHKFIKGDWFGKHNDIRENRLYAVGVLLNDNFEGGNFNLYNQNKIMLNKVTGNTYIFDVRIEHEVTPILEGERYSLLWFLQMENIKAKINKLL